MHRVKKRTKSECCDHSPNVLRTGAAAATDPVAAGLAPFPGKFAESGGVGGAGPAAGFGDPGLARVGVDGDALFRDSADFPDERQDVARRGAIDADGDNVWSCVEQACAYLDWLTVAGVGVVAAGEADVGGNVRERREGFEDGFGLGQRGYRLEGQKISRGVAHGVDA